jgi:hypothetical protein
MSNSNKIYPPILEETVLKALSYFPVLNDVPIEFKFKKNIKRSTMQAQPRFSKIFSPIHKREYLILIKTRFKLGDVNLPIEELPEEILTGWLGHELGHIMDYHRMSNWKLIWFGMKYLTSNKAIINAERRADEFAVRQGMHEYILKTKDFFFNHADISEQYKKRIKKFYLSPEEIMELVTE